MDPLFLSHLAQQAQHRMHLIALGRQTMREAETLNQRRELLASAQEEVSQILQEASAFPQRALVRLQLLISNLNYSGVAPDSFEDNQEKEEVVLLWRKLSNLWQKMNSQLTADQLAQCQECLDAIVMEFFIQTLASRLEAYEKYQLLQPIWEEVRLGAKKMAVYQKTGWAIGSIGLSIIMVWVVSYSSTPRYGANAMIMVGMISFLVLISMGFLLGIFDISNQQSFQSIDQYSHQLSEDAQIDDHDFWQAVTDKFGGIPTADQLQQSWDEQETRIRLVFGEPEDELSPA